MSKMLFFLRKQSTIIFDRKGSDAHAPSMTLTQT